MAGRPLKPIHQSDYRGRFAAHLRRLRGKKKLSVAEAAALIGVKAYVLYSWEQGRRLPALDDLPAIAAALGCTPRHLLPE